MTEQGIASMMEDLGRAARDAARTLARTSGEQRNAALSAAAAALRRAGDAILAANERDLASARERGLAAAMLDRLALDPARLEGIAAGLEAIVELPDPLGRVLAEWTRPNGLCIQRVSVPLGVIGMVFESRPNVTADAAGLCLKSGNAVILRGGSESFESSRAIHAAIAGALDACGLPAAAVQLVPTRDRAAVGHLLAMREWIDVVVPRGGKSLIRRVQEDARVPVIGHLEGICHVYLHASADADMAQAIVLNAKMRRTGICGAAETLLVDRAAVERLVPAIVAALVEAGCEVRGDEAIRRVVADRVVPAAEADWSSEYLDAIISVRAVDGVEGAIEHIRRYGSGHTESIVAEDAAAAEAFLAGVDSAIVLHNASTQFADGGEFGMGAEIGIATGRIHARGPVGAEQLTSYKYVVRGAGQLRP